MGDSGVSPDRGVSGTPPLSIVEAVRLHGWTASAPTTHCDIKVKAKVKGNANVKVKVEQNSSNSKSKNKRKSNSKSKTCE